jgi:hypothetical protein
MKQPSKNEEAALVAAFSLANRKRWNRPIHASETELVWRGWSFCADELIDNAGNRYGQSEIRAIFYTRQIIVDLKNELEKLRPPQPQAAEWTQLSLGLTPMWKMYAKW